MADADLEPRPDGNPRFQGFARIALVVALAVLGVWTLHGFLPALVWAVILAIAVWPLYQRAELRFPPGRHNILLPAVFTLCIGLVFVAPLLIAGVQAGREVHDVIGWYQGVQKSGLPAPEWLGGIQVGEWRPADWWRQNLSSPEPLSAFITRARHGVMQRVTGEFGMQLVHRVVIFFFTLLTLFFLFRDGRVLSAELLTASQRLFGPRGERLGRQMVASVHGTVDGLVLVGLGEGVVLWISYLIAGVPHPTLMGALTAVAAVIPFGAPVIFCIAAVILLAQGSVAAAVGIVVFGFIVVGIADHVIRPVMIGGATRLPFLWVLFGILGGVETWGLLGLFLGPAIMAALILLWREFTEEPEARLSDEVRTASGPIPINNAGEI